MKTIWKGAISFGLVTIPVRVYGATEAKSLRFNQLHEPDGGRIRYKRVCSVDGEEVDYSEIVKGYEYEKDHYVTLTDEELDRLAPPDTVLASSTSAIVASRFTEGLAGRARCLVGHPVGLVRAVGRAVQAAGEADRVTGGAQLDGLARVLVADDDRGSAAVGQAQEPVVRGAEQCDGGDVRGDRCGQRPAQACG